MKDNGNDVNQGKARGKRRETRQRFEAEKGRKGETGKNEFGF